MFWGKRLVGKSGKIQKIKLCQVAKNKKAHLQKK